MKFEERTLGDVLDFYDHIRVPLSSLERETRQGEYRYYGAQGVIDHIDEYLFDGEFILIAEDGANLVTRKEPIAFLVDGQFWVNNHAHVVRGKEYVADSFYIAVLLNNLNIAGYITGAAQPKLSQQNLKQIKVQLPSYNGQRRIADILSAYDDLIENNRRRMALLEESARLLYWEWFVRLRFPGHEHTHIINSVPEGWDASAISDMVEVQSGFAFKSSTYQESGKHGIVTIKNVQDGEFLTNCDSALVDPPEKMPVHCRLSTGDILLSLTGNIGRTCLVVGENYLLNQRVAKLVPRVPMARGFVYFAFRNEAMRKQLESISYGVAQQNLSPVKMSGLPFVNPPIKLLRQFAEFTEPIIDQLLVLKQQNQKLKQARPLLLPMLMSGEIVV